MPPKSKSAASASAAREKAKEQLAKDQQNQLLDGPIKCAGCGQESNSVLQCPTCRELKLKPHFFCSQECFTASWSAHKKVHDVCYIPAFPDDNFSRQFKFTGDLRPGLLSPKRIVPKDIIPRPDYATNREGRSAGEEKVYKANTIPQLNGEEIVEMKKMCRHGREILNLAANAVRPGATTDEIDRLVHEATIERGLYPSTLNYMGYRKSLCTSINEVVCHGIPDSRELQDGDILNLDISAFGNGEGRNCKDLNSAIKMHTDLNETVFVGKPKNDEVLRLVFCAFESMVAGITTLKPGNLYRHVGDAIQTRAELDGFDVARSVFSHGVGKYFHSPPDIAHFRGNKNPGIMKENHVVTIEPMVNIGTWQTSQWPDDWTIVTADGKWSAQFENSCRIVSDSIGQQNKSFFGNVEVLTSLSSPYLDTPFFLKQLDQWGIARPKSRLPEMGLRAPLFDGPCTEEQLSSAITVHESKNNNINNDEKKNDDDE